MEQGDLLEAFFSIIICIHVHLWTNFHSKFHYDFKNNKVKEHLGKSNTEIWKELTDDKIRNFDTIVFISYSTGLLNKEEYDEINELKSLRNKIAHKMIFWEDRKKKEGFNGYIYEKEVKEAIKKGIEIDLKLRKQLGDIVFEHEHKK